MTDHEPQNREQQRNQARAIGACLPAGPRGRVGRRVGKRREKFGAALPLQTPAFNAHKPKPLPLSRWQQAMLDEARTSRGGVFRV